jgi:acetyl-CoA C-acetyltransferase
MKDCGQMPERVTIVGVGMVPFVPAGAGASGVAERAIRSALDQAGIDAELVDQAVASHVHGDPTLGERALAHAGLTGIAVSNVSNGSASGATALFHARQALLSGEAQCVLAVGFEAQAASATPRPEAVQRCAAHLDWVAEHMRLGEETLARIAVAARARAALNPYAAHREPLSLADALAAPLIAGRARTSYVSGPSCGAAAVVLCTPRFAAQHGLRDDVQLAALALASDGPEEAGDGSARGSLAGSTARRVAERAYQAAGVDPAEIQVAEVHDCCVAGALIRRAALGLCAEDDIEGLIRSCVDTSGDTVVSPSGGLLALGDAPGAIGLAQACELTWQLRGEAGARQVAGARIGLQHNGGDDGAVVVAILRRKD